MRVNRLSKLTVYSRVKVLVIATVNQHKEWKSRSLALTTDLEVIPELNFARRRPWFTVTGAGSCHLTSMDVAFALEAQQASSIFLCCTWRS